MTDLTDTEICALTDALDDEYKAWATYDQVIADFGEVAPFRHIREAEARHIAALRILFTRYGLAIPENPWPGRVPRFASLTETCAAGVTAEIENANLYERLLPATRRSDILGVFSRLQAASQERHLRAFELCAQGLGTLVGIAHDWRAERAMARRFLQSAWSVVMIGSSDRFRAVGIAGQWLSACRCPIDRGCGTVIETREAGMG